MKRLLRIVASTASQKSFAAFSAALVLTIYVLLGVSRLEPFVDDVNVANSTGDDWLRYKQNAVSIVEGGLGMPSVPGPYVLPGGFLYNYYVAGVFGLFGVNSSFVYLSHYVLLAFGAIFMFLIGRRTLWPPLALALLAVTAAVLLYLFGDILHRLLSESLVVALYPAAFLLILAAVKRGSPGLLAVAGAVTAAAVLTRNNLLGLPFLITPLVFVYTTGDFRRRVLHAMIFLAAAAAILSLLPLRNVLVSGEFSGPSKYEILMPQASLWQNLELIGRKLLFCAGIFVGGWDHKGSDLVVHKSWLLLSALAFAGVVASIVRRRFELIDALCVATLIAAYLPFAILPPLGGYGMRFQMPYAPVLLLLAFRFADPMIRSLAGARDEPRTAAVTA